ncbi:hypothetical protein L2E82_47945 [Cichorium intybus]|uniref:Uncharacterized protein n=1 Tax=Cichorium intybus TaxID=13427 RepID=A0ACB8YXY5_CICIN|nr:hypothetical protein L2E82_47945 [Cichorium intybus]
MCSTALNTRRAEVKSAARRTLDYKLSVHNEVYLLIQILKAIKELPMTFDVVRVASFQKYHPRPDDLRWFVHISQKYEKKRKRKRTSITTRRPGGSSLVIVGPGWEWSGTPALCCCGLDKYLPDPLELVQDSRELILNPRDSGIQPAEG